MDTLLVILITLSSLQNHTNRFDSLAREASNKFDKEILIPMLDALKRDDDVCDCEIEKILKEE